MNAVLYLKNRLPIASVAEGLLPHDWHKEHIVVDTLGILMGAVFHAKNRIRQTYA